MDPHTIEKLGIIGTLVALGGSAMRWLLAERRQLLDALGRAHQRERELRDRRADELLAQAQALSQSSEVVKDALGEVTRALERLEVSVEHARSNR